MKRKVLSIMVIDDHPIIHDGLKMLFATEDDLKIVANAESSAEALQILQGVQPDIIIIDLSLGDADGTYLIQRISRKYPKCKIIVYSMSEAKLFGERSATAGASGYVMKTSTPSELRQAIRTVGGGDLYFSDNILEKIEKRELGKSLGPQSLLDNLSNREMDIFKLVGEGFDTSSIGKKLNISRNTVDTHRINIKNKLGLSSGKALDRLAFDIIKSGKYPQP